LRPLFSRRRAWLGELCRIAARLLEKACRVALPGAKPAFIEFVQTFGDLVTFHPHVHVLAADGVFRADGTFMPLPPIPEALLEGGFRRAVLDFLVGKGAISDELRGRMLGWRYSGFSVHNQVRVAADDAEGRKKLAAYMLRAPPGKGGALPLPGLAKMSYDAASGTVIYRSKMHLGLKRNFQVMPGARWLELLCKHIPDRYEQLVRYCGWYSSRSRGVRKAKGATAVATPASGVIEVLGEYASRAKLAWARLIRKVYEADPLVCSKCKGPMRVIALIEDPAVVRAILTHLGLWQPQALERAPPAPARAWPEHANLALTYHPLPDIA
jgi:hypothetical protein